MPLPATRVIPDGWETHHQPVAEGQMTAEGTVTRQADATGFDEASGRSVYPSATPVYTGPMRVQASQRLGSQQTMGDRLVPIKRYQVAIPVGTAAVLVNDVVTVTAATDPEQVGLTLIVIEVTGGSLLWQHDLVCEEWQPASR